MPLWSVLLALGLAAAILRDKRGFGAACVLLANWAACKALADATGTQFNWLALAAVDFVSAAVLAGPPIARVVLGMPIAASRINGALSLFYGVALVAHAAFGLSRKGAWATYEYWWATHYVAWAQAWCLALWEAWGGGHRLWRRSDHRSSGRGRADGVGNPVVVLQADGLGR